MRFELSDELLNEIVFAMEDQTGMYMFDALDAKIIAKDAACPADSERFYDLPVWDSIRGFQIRERFVHLLANPAAREKLREALSLGKNVFKNFKTVLKSFPEVEKLWYVFKKREMQMIILNWYNDLRETWGMEKVGLEPEETEDLVYEDFVFRLSSGEGDAEAVLLAKNEYLRELESCFEEDLGRAVSSLWQKLCDDQNGAQAIQCVCETVSGEFAGCLSLSECSLRSPAAVFVSSWYIHPQYRGLGLGKELLRFCLEKCVQKGIQFVILANLVIPDYISTVLFRSGFRQLGSSFIADLRKRGDGRADQQRGRV